MTPAGEGVVEERQIPVEGGTLHSGFQNVISKFTPHTVQKPQNQKQYSFHGESLK
jgi:hypothetical protein